MHADGPSLTESIRKTPLGVRHAFGVRRADLATLRDRLLYERTPAFVQEIEHEEIAGILQRRTCGALLERLMSKRGRPMNELLYCVLPVGARRVVENCWD